MVGEAITLRSSADILVREDTAGAKQCREAAVALAEFVEAAHFHDPALIMKMTRSASPRSTGGGR